MLKIFSFILVIVVFSTLFTCSLTAQADTLSERESRIEERRRMRSRRRRYNIYRYNQRRSEDRKNRKVKLRRAQKIEACKDGDSSIKFIGENKIILNAKVCSKLGVNNYRRR